MVLRLGGEVAGPSRGSEIMVKISPVDVQTLFLLLEHHITHLSQPSRNNNFNLTIHCSSLAFLNEDIRTRTCKDI